jgi:predicted dehydrogenase
MTSIPKASLPRAVLVGAYGKQGCEYYHSLNDAVLWAGLVDPATASPGTNAIPRFGSVRDAIQAVDFDLALVAVPHRAHFAISDELLRAGKHVLKDKPFGLTVREATQLAALSQHTDRAVLTLVQRNFQRPFQQAYTELALIGKPYRYRYDYHIDLARPTSGWRADRNLSGGGVLCDMGYHVLDIVGRLFGSPMKIIAEFSYRFHEMRQRKLEDCVSLTLSYAAGLHGTISISRHHYRRHERFEILGSKGAIVVSPSHYYRYSRSREVLFELYESRSKSEITAEMVDNYLQICQDPGAVAAHLTHHLSVVSVMQAAYASALRASDGATRSEGLSSVATGFWVPAQCLTALPSGSRTRPDLGGFGKAAPAGNKRPELGHGRSHHG